MQQLSGLDASFLHIETATAPTHIGSVALFDDAAGTPMTVQTVQDLVADRLGELPPYRRRLLETPLGLDHPYWVEDADFDLDFHIRHLAVPAPGDHRQLADLVARLHARPLDRAHPLWELYVIEGLASGHVAWYSKIHHACVDGVTGAEIMTTLLDRDPGGRVVAPEPWEPERVPGSAELLGRGVLALASQPRAQFRLQRRMARVLARRVSQQVPPVLDTLRETLDRTAGLRGLGRRLPDGEYLSRPALVAPRLSFNGRISAHRRLAFGSLALDDVKAVRRWARHDQPDVTVNDVVMAVVAGGLRTWLQRRHELPGDPLLAMVPVSVRDPGQPGATGNRISAMVAALPTHEADAPTRLRLAHEAMRIAKDEHAAMPADLLQDLGAFAPPAVAARAARVVTRLRIPERTNPPFNLVISNIPGPQHPLYAAGHRQTAAFPVPVISGGVGLNVTVLSYDGQVHVGVVACRDAVADLWDLVDDLGVALAELHQLATDPT